MQHGVAPGNFFIAIMRHCFSNGSGTKKSCPSGGLAFLYLIIFYLKKKCGIER